MGQVQGEYGAGLGTLEGIYSFLYDESEVQKYPRSLNIGIDTEAYATSKCKL